MQNLVIISAAGIALLIGVFSQWKSRQFKVDLEKREEETRRRMYELASNNVLASIIPKEEQQN